MKRLVALLILAIFIITPAAKGQSLLARAEVDVRVDVPALIKLELAPEEIVFTSDEILSGQEEFGRIVVEKSQAVLVAVVGNTPYSVYVSAETDYFAGPDGAIPIDRLEWRYPSGDEDAPWRVLSTESVEIFRQHTAGTIELEMDFRLTILMTDPIGLYQGALLFTLGNL